MKVSIEEYLYRIDQAFAEKSEKDTYLVYAMIFAVIFGIAYLLFWDSAEQEFQAEHKKVETMQGKINVDKTYLAQNPPAKIVQIENETKALQKEYIDFQDYNAYIKHQINQISSLFYNEESWGQYIDSIVDDSKKYDIHMVDFNNSFTDNKNGFGHVLDIGINANGDYLNLLQFINSLEQSFLVVDLHALKFKAEEQLNADLNISVWGISY